MNAPDIVITRGNPDDVDIAAVVTVLAALAAGGAAPVRREHRLPPSAWRSGHGFRYHKAPAAWGTAARIHRHPDRAAPRWAEEQR
ncbi:acyl-CoA carboxylase epsilon subunit [Nocardia sp. CC227C]|uniref:acyl-CoA carboxylase epsilon subunit n=1 Tax=Nocardia sp. CC227C TaxID=3044562 RepID=UPI00278BFDEA|nr:acyl-CoA carboxylase epsilon subunit [Nocardia sp. CC227C]